MIGWSVDFTNKADVEQNINCLFDEFTLVSFGKFIKFLTKNIHEFHLF